MYDYCTKSKTRFQIIDFKLVSGAEGGILLPPSPASRCDTYSSAIIPCVCAGYKRIRSQAGVSTVSLIGCDSHENSITGISGGWERNFFTRGGKCKDSADEGQTVGGVVYTDGKMPLSPTHIPGFDFGRGPPARVGDARARVEGLG